MIGEEPTKMTKAAREAAVYETDEYRNATESPNAQRVPLEKRAEKLGKQELLKELQKRARDIERKLHTAYRIPVDIKIGDPTMHILQKDLLKLAQDARALADQYRSFKVGTVMLAIRETSMPNENPWVVVFSANTKPTDEPGTKHCGEQYLMDLLDFNEKTGAPEEDEDLKIKKVLSFVVVGPAQRDDDSKTDQVTLTPCIICRNRMAKVISEGGPITPETEVVTARAENTQFQKIQTVADLQHFHGEKNAYYDDW